MRTTILYEAAAGALSNLKVGVNGRAMLAPLPSQSQLGKPLEFSHSPGNQPKDFPESFSVISMAIALGSTTFLLKQIKTKPGSTSQDRIRGTTSDTTWKVSAPFQVVSPMRLKFSRVEQHSSRHIAEDKIEGAHFARSQFYLS